MAGPDTARAGESAPGAGCADLGGVTEGEIPGGAGMTGAREAAKEREGKNSRYAEPRVRIMASLSTAAVQPLPASHANGCACKTTAMRFRTTAPTRASTTAFPLTWERIWERRSAN